MKTLTYYLTFTFILSCIICAPAFSQSGAYTPGQILIKMKPEKSIVQKAHLKDQMNATQCKTFPKLGIELWEVEDADVSALINQYSNHPDIEFVEPNYIYSVSAATTPNDPSFNDQWALNNTGQNGGTPDADIDAPEAWDIVTGSPSMVVAIIDTGIDWTHEDLVDNIWQNPGEDADGDGHVLEFIGGTWVFDPGDENGIDDDGNGYIDDFIGWDFRDNDNDPISGTSGSIRWHGTHIAGIVGASSNNNTGITGVTWDVQMAALKFFSDSGSGDASDAIEALNYAVIMNIPISNNSWGGGVFSQAFYDAVENAKNNGHLLVAATGRNNSDSDTTPYYPSSYDNDNIISVTSTDTNDNLSPLSNYGANTVDLGAPGGDIYSCLPINSYDVRSGTSMAAPHVTGACALIWGLYPNKTYTEIKDAILNSVDPNADLNGKCVSNGRLNLYNAIGYFGYGDFPINCEDPYVLPGDMNNDGVFDQDDVLYWGIGAGLTGPVRPNATTDCTLQLAPDWSITLNGVVNAKHADSNGDGVIDGADLDVLNMNFGSSDCVQPITPCHIHDWIALKTLYESTDGDNWINNSGWSEITGPLPSANCDLGVMYGVTLDANGRVTTLSLPNNQLNGSLPAELGHLCDLTKLYLNSNQLSGSIPTEIENLSNLTELFLNSNQLTGNIPSEIWNLTNLVSLSLWENQFSGVISPAIGNLSELTNLWLGINQLIGGIPAEIGDLTNLEILYLRSNQLSGSIPSNIGNLTNLRILNLRDNLLTGSIPPEIGNLGNLTDLRLYDNQFSGCYEASLMNLCSQLSNHNNNHISNGNNLDAPWEDFCNTNLGICGGVLPGDCNTDGIVNLDDVLYWGLAQGFIGIPRPDATTDCSIQACPDWSQSVGEPATGNPLVNGKHQDCDGDGTVDGQDNQIIITNFGCVSNYTAPTYASAVPIYNIQPQGINAVGKYQYDLHVENGSGASAIAHGLAFTVSSDVIPISAIAMSVTGSSLHPDEAFAITDGNRCHVALTRTDNLDVICDGPIATFVVEASDIPVGVPFEIDVAFGSKIKADATLDNLTGATAFGMYNGLSPNTNNIFLDASVTHEQCNGLGEALVIPSGGIPPYTYLWSNGANTAQVNNLTSGTYAVTVTDSNGLNQNLNLQINGQTPIYDANGNLLCGNLCPEYLAPSGITGNGLYRANNALNSDAIIPTGNIAQYKAGQTIELKSGFKVQPNAEFSAEIEDCQ